jgi:alkanesulfonate monooxygenase SsuD/methylene tetrahydromethanopterin reductase-like flavin-dependent oxidoreductase (luciferase family)
VRFSLMLPRVGVGGVLDPDALAELCLAVETLGFAAVTVTDHPAPPAPSDRHTGLDPFAALAAVGAVTTRLRLHTGVLVLPYRHPLLVAQGAATVQLLSGGRLILGLGVGYLPEEFAALGVRVEERGRLMDEALPALRKVLTTEASPPPLWIGGNGARAQERAVTHGDGWMPFEPPPDSSAGESALGAAGLAPLVEDLRRRCERAGREDLPDVCFVRPLPTWLEADAARVEEELGQLHEAGVTWLAIRPPGTTLPALIEAATRFAAIAGLRPCMGA